MGKLCRYIPTDLSPVGIEQPESFTVYRRIPYPARRSELIACKRFRALRLVRVHKYAVSAVLGLSMILSDGAASVLVTSLVPGWPSADLVVGRLVVTANCGEGEQQRLSQSRY